MFVLPLARTTTRRAVDESFDRFFANAFGAPTGRTPALDVLETDAAYIVTLDVPGVAREQLKVAIEGRRVNVETVDAPAAVATPPADAPAADTPKTQAPRVLYRERSTARFARTVSLPTEVDQAASQAKVENGVLTLTLAKRVKSGATLLDIA